MLSEFILSTNGLYSYNKAYFSSCSWKWLSKQKWLKINKGKIVLETLQFCCIPPPHSWIFLGDIMSVWRECLRVLRWEGTMRLKNNDSFTAVWNFKFNSPLRKPIALSQAVQSKWYFSNACRYFLGHCVVCCLGFLFSASQWVIGVSWARWLRHWTLDPDWRRVGLSTVTPPAESSPTLKAGPKDPISVYISLPQYLSLFLFFDVYVLMCVFCLHYVLIFKFMFLFWCWCFDVCVLFMLCFDI